MVVLSQTGVSMTYPVYTGKLLVATPTIDDDPTFKESIVYITEEKNETVFGFILNKPTTLKVSDVVTAIEGESFVNEQKVHMGGPVGQEALFLLHTDEWYAKTTKQCQNGLAVSSDYVMLEKIMTGNLPKDYKLMAGLSTWHPRQLAMEIHKGGWLVIDDPTAEIMFSYTGKNAWTKAIEQAGLQTINTFF